MAEARGPMGLRKDLHIEALLNVPAIRGRWIKVHGKAPTEETVKNMFKDFVPLQLAVLPKYTRLIPGTAATVQQLRDEFQLRIGMTTGFQQEMTAILLAAAKQQGFSPDVHVAGDEVTKPRPWPYMVWKNMERLQLADPSLVVKVDDTASGIGEGLNAGAWTVGCYATSNYMDIDSPEHRNSLVRLHFLFFFSVFYFCFSFPQSTEEFERRAQKSRDILRAAGAHVLIRDITWLPGAIRQLNHRLARGEYPPPFV